MHTSLQSHTQSMHTGMRSHTQSMHTRMRSHTQSMHAACSTTGLMERAWVPVLGPFKLQQTTAQRCAPRARGVACGHSSRATYGCTTRLEESIALALIHACHITGLSSHLKGHCKGLPQAAMDFSQPQDAPFENLPRAVGSEKGNRKKLEHKTLPWNDCQVLREASHAIARCAGTPSQLTFIACLTELLDVVTAELVIFIKNGNATRVAENLQTSSHLSHGSTPAPASAQH
jgi:hypothetical protein